MSDYTALAEYRHRVAAHYAAARANLNPAAACAEWRSARDRLLQDHPMSALADHQREGFQGIPYMPYNAAWRFELAVHTDVTQTEHSGELPEGTIRYTRFGVVRFTTPAGDDAVLSLFWIQGYGGGIFLPFRDATNGDTTYGGGRYLLDTIKGADLGSSPGRVVLDFNFAYHPSCFYNARWLCPLAPPENHLPFAVPVGEVNR